MKFPAVKLNTVTGARWFRRARDLAMRLIKTRGHGKTEIVDGYLIKATRAASQATAVVIDPPGMVAANGRWCHRVGSRDHYNSQVGVTDGPYELGVETREAMLYWYYLYGYDRDAQDLPFMPNHWKRAYPIRFRDWYYAKRDIVRFSGLIRSPIESNQLPIPDGATIFSGVFTLGPKSVETPGYWWTNERMVQLTGGYGLARIANMLPLTFNYQGDAPVSWGRGSHTLIVTPLVKNGPVEMDDAVAAWGHSAVRIALIRFDDISGPAVEEFARLWKPDEHSCSFFHNGPWLGRPDLPTYAVMVRPKPEPYAAWDRWWEANSAGGSRPNWTDCMSVIWFNGRFIVTLRVAAFNGAYTPGQGDRDPMYRMACGTAHMRFDIGLDGAFTATEESYEVWNAPEEYAGAGSGATPYSLWVDGVLDDERARSALPAALLATDSWLVEVTHCTDVYRRSARAIPFPTGGWRYLYAVDLDADRLEFRVTRVIEGGEEAAPQTYVVRFTELGCGIDSQRMITYDRDYRSPPLDYAIRACDPQFVVLSDREIGFLARLHWRDRFAEPNTVFFVVFDLDSGLATVRADTGLVAQWADDHMLCPHLDCIQQATYNADGEVVMEGVLLATSGFAGVSHLSRDSGRTWELYLTGHPIDSEYSAAAYFVGNQYGGGSTPGRAII